MSGVLLRLVPLAGDGPLLSFGHFPLQGELHSAALTTHCVVIHYRLDHRPLQNTSFSFYENLYFFIDKVRHTFIDYI